MAIFITENSKVLVQGITGGEGTKHTRRMVESGTNIVAGVTPGKGGQFFEHAGHKVPIFNSVADAAKATSRWSPNVEAWGGLLWLLLLLLLRAYAYA